MKKIIIIVVFFGSAVLASIYFLNRLLVEKQNLLSGKNPVIIGFSIGATREERWFEDRDLFIEKAQELGAVVSVALSDYDVDKQIENLISQGAKVIVVIPSDAEKIAPAVEKANQAGVKIIAYDRLINNCKIDFYISFDNKKIGELQAKDILAQKKEGNFAYLGGASDTNVSYLLKEGTMSVLNPEIETGKVNLVINQFVDGWKPEIAQEIIKKYLDSGKPLDAVIAANDGIASGVIKALGEKGLSGKVPVSGQDAELPAVQRIVSGVQSSTTYKPIKLLAYKAAEIAVAIANGKSPEVTGTVFNGVIDVPAHLLPPILVDKKSLVRTVIRDGLYTPEEIYTTSTR